MKDIILNSKNNSIEIENINLKKSLYPSVIIEQEVDISQFNYATEKISRKWENSDAGKAEYLKEYEIHESKISEFVAWINIVFYQYFGDTSFTYGIYWPKTDSEFELYHLIENDFDANRTIDNYLDTYSIHMYDNKELKDLPEIAMIFLYSESEKIIMNGDFPNIFCVFNIGKNKCKLSIYYKKCYSVNIIKNTLDGVKAIFLSKSDETLIKDIKLQDLSINAIKNYTITEKDSLITRFDINSKMYPDKIIYEDEHEKLSYCDMSARIDEICSGLKHKRKRNIAILGANSVQKIIGVIAIIKSGNIYIPIDQNSPQKRVNELIKEFDIDFIVCDSKEKVMDYLCPVCSYSELRINNKKASVKWNNNNLDPICILSTSGTTGAPKKVVHNQLSIINAINEYTNICKFTEDDVIGLRSPLQHVPSTVEIFIGLVLGIKTVIIPERLIVNPDKLYSYLTEHKITWIQMVPSIIDACFAKHGVPQNLKYLVSLGENLSKDLAKTIIKKSNLKSLITNYGMTEFNMITLGTLSEKSKASSIGKAISNTQVAIINTSNKIVPKGIIGQITVCSFNNGKNIYSSNRENMVYVSEINEYMYLTGDYGYYLEDGEEIVYIGRKDLMCKIHGKRVELSYVETVIKSSKVVKDCKVIKEEYLGKDQIVAYVVPYNSASVIELKKYLRDKLEPFMIPEVFLEISEMPKTETGKIKVSVLKEMLSNRQKVLKADIKSIVEEIIGHKVESQTSFKDLGMSSLQMLELSSKIEKTLEIDIDIASLYNYSTINELESYLLKSERIGIEKIENSKIVSEKIAVIGISGLLPDNLEVDEFWEAIKSGHDFVGEFPQHRRKKIGYNLEDTIIPGAYFKNIEYFESLFFGISPREGEYMSYEQKFALMYVWKLLENSGYTKEMLDNENISVFIGLGDNYNSISVDDGNRRDLEYKKLGSDTAMVAARISYFFNWHGTCTVLNTACSSSLLALDLAYKSIVNDGADFAIAGGMNIVTSKQFFEDTSSLGMFAESNDCFPFDDRATGIVPGEAVGFVLLKPLEKALNDHDYIYAVIDGTCSNQDGKSNGITAPNGLAQEQLIKRNLSQTGIKPETITYIEAHGTGTRLGDPIEFSSLSNVFSIKERCNYCALGSVKANIGHTIAAAGIVGFIKACMCLKDNYLPPQIKFEVPNKLLNVVESPFYINIKLEKLLPEERNIICINSFGYSGTNVNVLLENNNGIIPDKMTEQKYYFFPISAKTEMAFWQQIKRLAKYLQVNNFNVVDVAYTLQAGRTHFKEYRKVFIAKNISELIMQLESYHFAHKLNGDVIDKEEISIDDRMILEHFEAGELINWKDFADDKGFRVPLPTYPFDDNLEKIEVLESVTDFGDDNAILLQHHIGDECIIPASKIISLVLESNLTGMSINQIENIYFLESIKLDMRDLVNFKLENGQFIFSSNNLIHSKGEIGICNDNQDASFCELDEVQNIYSVEDIYDYYNSCGIFYGTSFQKCSYAKLGKSDGKIYAFTEICLENIESSDMLTVLLDVSFHSINYVLNEHDNECMIPYFVRRIRLLRDIKENSKYYVLGYKDKKGININIFDADKKCVITIEGFTLVPKIKTIELTYPIWKESNNTISSNNSEEIVSFDYGICFEESVEFKNIHFESIINWSKGDIASYKIDCSDNSILDILIMMKSNYTGYFEAYKLMMLVIRGLYKCKKVNLLVVYFYNKNSANIINASIESFLKVIHNENPKITFKMLEIPYCEKCEYEKIISAEKYIPYQNTLIKYNKNYQRLILSQQVEKMKKDVGSRRLKNHATYLIAGGMGGIGRIIGEYLAQKYNANIIYVGRKAIDDSISQFLERMKKFNTRPQYLQIDITSKKSLHNCLKPMLNKIDGVINCAGLINDSFFITKEFEDSQEVLETKIIGSLNLYELFRESDIEFLILFSSVSADIGSIGQCDYAYANKFISLFCEGVKSPFHLAAIDWGYWKDGGMKMDKFSYKKMVEQDIREITSKEGCELLEAVINSDLSHVLIY